MTIRMQSFLRSSFLGLACLGVVACDNDPAPAPPMASFSVAVTNLSNAQPLSPVALIAHQTGFEVFSIGAAATAGLERLAEEGNNSALLAEADGDANVLTTESGMAVIAPGGSETVTVVVSQNDLPGLLLSLSTMLVNTNDAITGLNAVDIGSMLPGESIVQRSIAYDAGTEMNLETALTIPGPAAGGEGFNAARDDIADRVTMHSGIVGMDDGHLTSALTGQHRFDNPVAQVRIERIN